MLVLVYLLISNCTIKGQSLYDHDIDTTIYIILAADELSQINEQISNAENMINPQRIEDWGNSNTDIPENNGTNVFEGITFYFYKYSTNYAGDEYDELIWQSPILISYTENSYQFIIPKNILNVFDYYSIGTNWKCRRCYPAVLNSIEQSYSLSINNSSISDIPLILISNVFVKIYLITVDSYKDVFKSKPVTTITENDLTANQFLPEGTDTKIYETKTDRTNYYAFFVYRDKIETVKIKPVKGVISKKEVNFSE